MSRPEDPEREDEGVVEEFLALIEDASPDLDGDFGLLEAEQVHRLMFHPFESEDVVVFADVLSAPPDAEIATLLDHLLRSLSERPMKATARGNLPRPYVVGAEEHFFERHGASSFDVIRPAIRGEQDFRGLHVAREVARQAGLLRLARGEFLITKKGRTILERHGVAGVYPEAFRAYATKYEWSSLDRYPEAWTIQQSFAYSLYLLARLGDRPRRDTFYSERWARAFPETLAEFDEQEDELPNRFWFDACYGTRVLERFAQFFGLVDMRPFEGAPMHALERIVEVRPLLHEVVAFPLGEPSAAQRRA